MELFLLLPWTLHQPTVALSASDSQIVEISNLTKVVYQSEPIPAHCVIKVLKLYMLFYIKTNFRNRIVLKNAQP